jgi:16S rRNA (adenine1518-N6/adenine1519-N6)-dimethyltransferase
LFERLKTLFVKEIKEGRLELINEDILKIENLGLERYKLVANIPYYITGEILREFLSNRTQPEKIVLMLQKEVAERIVAKNGKESILSISVKAYGEPKYIRKVEKENFKPKPKVDSAILLIKNISRKNFFEIDEKEFFNLVKKGFSQKRKLLSNNLKDILKEKTKEIFENCKIPLKSRAENLSLSDWQCLCMSKK